MVVCLLAWLVWLLTCSLARSLARLLTCLLFWFALLAYFDLLCLVDLRGLRGFASFYLLDLLDLYSLVAWFAFDCLFALIDLFDFICFACLCFAYLLCLAVICFIAARPGSADSDFPFLVGLLALLGFLELRSLLG